LNNFFRQIVTNFVDFFSSLDMVRRIGLIAIAAITTTLVAAIIMWAAKTQYQVLYTDLTNEDSSQIAQMLEDAKINYQITDEGKTIRVPEDQKEKWRLEIAKRGVNFSSTIGYEVFDKQSFGTTSFVQKINKQRALEGELIKTIKHLRGVDRARVHLSIPESSPFVSEQKPPSASVVLELAPGVLLTNSEIKGVQQLVSAAVERMRPEHVVIINSRGKKLSENIGDAMTAETANRMALESKLNQKYEKQIEEILSRVVGEGKVIAKVAAKMDFTQKVETQTQYDGENTAVISEVNNQQKLQGSRPSPQGIPGARSNLPGERPQPGIPETRNDVDKSLVTRNYGVPSKVTRSTKPTADVVNLSVAVMLDGKRVPLLDENGVQKVSEEGIPLTKYEPWTSAEIENFRQIVASTLGINAARGDQLTIKNMEFAEEDLAAVEAMLERRENREIIKNLTKYLMIGIIITLFFFVVVRPFIQWVTENTVETIDDFLPKTIEELEKIQAGQKLPGLEDALPTIEEKINPEKIEGNLLKEKIINLIEQNPTKAAQIMHEMIHTVDDNKQIA
jgi:flagellar M-ring protein FliF